MRTVSEDIGDNAVLVGVALCCLLALALQFVVFNAGFVAASADESARALIAWNLSWRDLVVPEIWPPFYEVAVGLVLKVYPDLFYAPRLLATLFGLLSIGAITVLARELFRSNLVALLSAFLAVFLHHRLLLSVAPMAEIFFNFFVICGCCALARYANRGSGSAFVTAAGMFLLAATVRFEGWFICAAFVAVSFLVQVSSRPIGWTWFWTGAALACAFPVIWTGLSLYHFGDLSGITAASDQNQSANVSLVSILRRSHAAAFLRDLLYGPLLLGAVAALIVGWQSWPARVVLYVAVTGLVLSSVAAIATHSSALAAPWRIAGAWAALTVPFTAYALVWLAGRFGRLQFAVLPILAVAAVCLMAVPSWLIVERTIRNGFTFDADMLALRTELDQAIDDGDVKVLIDVGNVEFLDLVVAINRPAAMLYSTGSDPIGIALYIGQKEFWQASTSEYGRGIYEQYISLKTDPAADRAALSSQDIGYVLVQSADARQIAGASSFLADVGRFGRWSLYKVI